MEKVLIVCSCVVLSLNVVCGQYAQSPCPDIFEYGSDGSTIYGKIVLRPSAPVSQLDVRTNFTVATQLLSNYVGRIDAEDSNRLFQKYNQGLPVQYRVHFPVTSPLPKLTALTVNGDTICYGPADVPGPNQYVTTLSLRHTAFLQGAAPMYTFQPQHQSSPDLSEFVEHLGEDAQIFTFNNIDNSPNWSHGYYPYYIVNTSRPPQSIQPAYQQPTRPIHKQPPIRPSMPEFDSPDPYNSGIDDRSEQRPINNRHQTRPMFEQPVQEPVYLQTTTRPPMPLPPAQADIYYMQEHTTQEPMPLFTSRPPQKTPTSNIECGMVAGGNHYMPLVYNGTPYNRGDLPWLVAIYKSRGSTIGFICGGTLVSNRHVVTAAHCMHVRKRLTSIENFVIKVGVHNLNDWSDDITVTRNLMAATIHEAYNASTLENDILVFTLDKTVEFNKYIRPACLWSGNTDLSRIVGASGVVAGWGEQSVGGGGAAGEPRLVRVPVVSTAQCRASKPDFHWLTSAKTLCAGDRNGAGPCSGDSGGGLYMLDNGKWRLRGVVSVSLRPQNGEASCNLDEYIIFTDTAQYLTWIRNIISQNYFD